MLMQCHCLAMTCSSKVRESQEIEEYQSSAEPIQTSHKYIGLTNALGYKVARHSSCNIIIDLYVQPCSVQYYTGAVLHRVY